MAEVSVYVAGDNARLRALGARLREAGDKGLKRELSRGISKAVKPATQAVRSSTGRYLPARFAPVLAGSLQFRTSNAVSGLRITATGKGKGQPRQVVQMNAGQLRHPLFGNRGHWYVTRVQRGFFDEPIEGTAPDIRRQLEQVLDEVAAKIAGGG